jgi:hypothetical protein
MKIGHKTQLTFKGETKTLIDWANDLHLHAQTVIDRLRRGWSIDRSLSVEPILTKPPAAWPNFIRLETEKKVLSDYNKIVGYPNPGNHTFPTGGKDSVANRLSQQQYDYHFDFLLRSKRKDRWLSLRKELGEEYLENLRKQCYYMIAA